MRHVLIAMFLCCCIAQAQANGPTGFHAEYTISTRGLDIGHYQSELQNGPQGYHYQNHSEPTGILRLMTKQTVNESSEGVWHSGRPRPSRYRYDRNGGNKERHAHLLFDWDKRRVENTLGGDAWRMDIPEDTLDKFVVQLAVMNDLAQGKREMSYPIADGGKLKTYRFRVTGTETISTPAGRYETLKLERLHGKQKRATLLWCAPALDYLPVQVHQREDDENFKMVLTQYQPNHAR
jgi:hypothetical protein